MASGQTPTGPSGQTEDASGNPDERHADEATPLQSKQPRVFKTHSKYRSATPPLFFFWRLGSGQYLVWLVAQS